MSDSSYRMPFRLSYWETVYFNSYERSSLVNIRMDFPTPRRDETAEMFRWFNTHWSAIYAAKNHPLEGCW